MTKSDGYDQEWMYGTLAAACKAYDRMASGGFTAAPDGWVRYTPTHGANVYNT